MIDERCIGKDVDRAKVSKDAEVSGSSWVTGPRTRIAAGAIIRNSRLHDAAIEAAAVVLDTILIGDEHAHSHKCDAAARTVVHSAEQPAIGAGAHVSGCTLNNSSLGARTTAIDSWLYASRIGDDCLIKDAKIILCSSDHHVSVTGPTEVSESWLGHHAVIDRRGYLEGIFGNKFLQLRCDEAGRLKVTGTIDLPHVSKYGINTINSTNSGKLQPQEGKPIKSFGKPSGLWRGEGYLSHEQIELAPCCLVVPWTKVVGQSPLPHATDEELVNDDLTTYLMPFSIAGYQGELTRGMVMPGELSVGLGPKQRKGGWLFTYAPDAVFAMVSALHDALEPQRKAVADTIVIEAIQVAMEMTQAMAVKNKVDLSVAFDKQKMGWPKWIGTTYSLLKAHRDSGLWRFEGGEPVGWKKENGRWTHPAQAAVMAIAPDALDKQVSLEELYSFDDPVMAPHVALPGGAVDGTSGPAQIDPSAKVAPDAFVGPGCRIGTGVVVESGAKLWNSVLEDCRIGRNAHVARSIVRGGSVGADTTIRSCRMINSQIGKDSVADCASMVNSRLADQMTVSCFADVVDTTCTRGTIIGGTFHAVDCDVYLMSMHMAGGCRHMQALPIPVTLNGQSVDVPAIPMIGGGSLIRGTKAHPVVMQCAFVGSNAIIDEGVYLGFGSFILGHLGAGLGLLPFTLSTDNEPRHHQLGAVLANMASTVITHYIPWTYNATQPRLAPAVGAMIRQAIEEAASAIEWEMSRRAGQAGDGQAFARYTALALYEESQLKNGLNMFQRWLAMGSWDMTYENGVLAFTSAKGNWTERGGSGMWKEEK